MRRIVLHRVGQQVQQRAPRARLPPRSEFQGLTHTYSHALTLTRTLTLTPTQVGMVLMIFLSLSPTHSLTLTLTPTLTLKGPAARAPRTSAYRQPSGHGPTSYRQPSAYEHPTHVCRRGVSNVGIRLIPESGCHTRWITTLSSKVNLPHTIYFGVL